MSDFDNMLEDAVNGLRDVITSTVPDDCDAGDCFPPAMVVRYRDLQWLVMTFAREEDFQLEVIGYRDGRELIRRVIGMP